MGQRLIEALCNVDVLSLPSVSKVTPNVDTQVSTASCKALVSLVDDLKLV